MRGRSQIWLRDVISVEDEHTAAEGGDTGEIAGNNGGG